MTVKEWRKMTKGLPCIVAMRQVGGGKKTLCKVYDAGLLSVFDDCTILEISIDYNERAFYLLLEELNVKVIVNGPHV